MTQQIHKQRDECDVLVAVEKQFVVRPAQIAWAEYLSVHKTKTWSRERWSRWEEVQTWSGRRSSQVRAFLRLTPCTIIGASHSRPCWLLHLDAVFRCK
jgi:hypothetical protein